MTGNSLNKTIEDLYREEKKRQDTQDFLRRGNRKGCECGADERIDNQQQTISTIQNRKRGIGMNTLKIKKLHPDATIPTRAHETDAGLDLYALEDTCVQGGTLVSTGIAVDIPKGYEGTVRPKSGLTSKTRLRVQIGTVDAGYNGEVKVIADCFQRIKIEADTEKLMIVDHEIKKGDKIAQLVISPIETPSVEVVEEFDSVSERGANGFGSTDR